MQFAKTFDFAGKQQVERQRPKPFIGLIKRECFATRVFELRALDSDFRISGPQVRFRFPPTPLISESVHVRQKVSGGGVDFRKVSAAKVEGLKSTRKIWMPPKMTFFVEVDVIRFGFVLVTWPRPHLDQRKNPRETLQLSWQWSANRKSGKRNRNSTPTENQIKFQQIICNLFSSGEEASETNSAPLQICKFIFIGKLNFRKLFAWLVLWLPQNCLPAHHQHTQRYEIWAGASSSLSCEHNARAPSSVRHIYW